MKLVFFQEGVVDFFKLLHHTFPMSTPRVGRPRTRIPAPIEPENQRVGETITAFRNMAGMSQDELAGHLGMSRSYVAQIEAGYRRLRNPHLYAAAKTFNVPITAIKIPEPEQQALLVPIAA